MKKPQKLRNTSQTIHDSGARMALTETRRNGSLNAAMEDPDIIERSQTEVQDPPPNRKRKRKHKGRGLGELKASIQEQGDDSGHST